MPSSTKYCSISCNALLEQVALGPVDDEQMTLELLALVFAHLLEHDVLRELGADDVALGVTVDGNRVHSAAAAARSSARSNRKS